MKFLFFITAVSEEIQTQVALGSGYWMPVALVIAGLLISNKQFRRQKRKLFFQLLKKKALSFHKRQLEHPGLFIVSIVMILACFGVAIALGMLKEFLILIGAVLLLVLLLFAALKNS